MASYEMNEVMYVDVLLIPKRTLTSSLQASINSRNDHFPAPDLPIWVLRKSFPKPHEHTLPRLIHFSFLSSGYELCEAVVRSTQLGPFVLGDRDTDYASHHADVHVV